MQRFALPIFIAITALLAGIIIGRYTSSSAPGIVSRRKNIPLSTETAANSLNPSPVSPRITGVASDSTEPAVAASSENIISKIKTALTHSGSRHTYATFSKIAETVDAKNVREVLAFVQTLPKPQEKSMLISLFVGRWAELDSPAAIAYAQTISAGTARNWAITSAVGGWAEHDATAATAWAQRLPVGPARDQAMQTIVSALADKDPQAAFDFLQSLPAGRNRQSLYWPIFSHWTMTDPVAAAERAMQIPVGANRDTALQVIGSNWANQDPEAAFTWANTLPPGEGRNITLQNILSSWANKDPQKAAAIYYGITGRIGARSINR